MDSVEEKENYKKNQPGFCKFFIAWEKTAIVVGTFLSWPTVVQKILEVMNCEKIGDKYFKTVKGVGYKFIIEE